MYCILFSEFVDVHKSTHGMSSINFDVLIFHSLKSPENRIFLEEQVVSLKE